MLTITSGKYKNISLYLPPENITRPISQKVRSAVFNTLAQRIVDSSVLDLYAGSGAMAIEAISRGAQAATLVENNFKSLSVIKKNIHKLDRDVYKRQGKIFTTYPENSIITSKILQKLLVQIIDLSTNLSDYLPSDIETDHKLINYPAAIKYLHFPNSIEQVEPVSYTHLNPYSSAPLSNVVMPISLAVPRNSSIPPIYSALTAGILSELASAVRTDCTP